MMHYGGGATKAKRTGAPECSERYHPMTGGTVAEYIESHGSPGPYPVDMAANPDQPSEEGQGQDRQQEHRVESEDDHREVEDASSAVRRGGGYRRRSPTGE